MPAPILPIAISSMDTTFPGSVFSTVDVYESFPGSNSAEGMSEIFPGEFQLAGTQTVTGDQIASIDGIDLPLVQFTLGIHDPPPGTYPLIASRRRTPTVLNDASDDALVEYVQIIDGSITILPRADAIVPEPGSIVLAGMAAICLAGVCRAHCRRRSQSPR